MVIGQATFQRITYIRTLITYNMLSWECRLQSPKKAALLKLADHLSAHKCFWRWSEHTAFDCPEETKHPNKKYNYQHPLITSSRTFRFQIRPDDDNQNVQSIHNLPLDSQRETKICCPFHQCQSEIAFTEQCFLKSQPMLILQALISCSGKHKTPMIF